MASTRIAVIDRELCIKEKCGYACEHVCPPNRMGEECITIEKATDFPVISEELCIGCGLCVKKCPMDCITIINMTHELTDPVYQYGINAFRLYGLPLPASGCVSLVGKNGIGKTSALKLLSRSMNPNFAQFDRALSEKEILEKLPIETRRYFQELGESVRMVSMKPQYVDRIRDAFKGTVRQLLETVAGKDAAARGVELFDLSKFLDRTLSQLSGGELQKTAIAVCYLKQADLYYFDEFTNYLDIEERLKGALILKDLSSQKQVMLAEHDLTILDYVSDYVYLFYGEENTYGIVSHIRAVRAGINEYIDGFLGDENVRFREYSLAFSSYSETEVKTKPKITYPSLSKSFNSFSFTSEGGTIREGEIIGLVGKNALGKSVFMKMLAGVEKSDAKLPELKISYKPQYIQPEDCTALELFMRHSLNNEVLEDCKRRLNLHTLLEKKLTELSGGELQRIALTLALSQPADLYLFDEPTAFLDIEQRFEFAYLLRKVIGESTRAAFVIDHDVVFMDTVASRLMVFEGESSVIGKTCAPLAKREGMNKFLKIVGVTMRRDKDSKRPRINKPLSALDTEQKKKGEYYYV